MREINITDQILKFREFLLSSWNAFHSSIEEHAAKEDKCFIEDWYEANWEFLVERELLNNKGYLPSFGIHTPQPRITLTDARPSHFVLCAPKQDSKFIDIVTQKRLPNETVLVFHSFCSKTENNFLLIPPFDLIRAVMNGSNETFHFYYLEINFYLCPLLNS